MRKEANVGAALPFVGPTASALLETHRQMIGASRLAFQAFGRALMRGHGQGKGLAATVFSAAAEAHLEFCLRAHDAGHEVVSGFVFRHDDCCRREP